MKNMKNSKLYKTLYADTAMKQIEGKPIWSSVINKKSLKKTMSSE